MDKSTAAILSHAAFRNISAHANRQADRLAAASFIHPKDDFDAWEFLTC